MGSMAEQIAFNMFMSPEEQQMGRIKYGEYFQNDYELIAFLRLPLNDKQRLNAIKMMGLNQEQVDRENDAKRVEEVPEETPAQFSLPAPLEIIHDGPLTQESEIPESLDTDDDDDEMEQSMTLE